jgi:hypothetical protein
MPPAKAQAKRAPRASRRPRLLSHRGLVAVEALLVCGIVKDLLVGMVRSSTLAPSWKVLFVMGVTVGFLGGLFFLIQRFTARTVAGGHRLARGLPLVLPYWIAHAAILTALFFVYANHLGIRVL